MWLCCPSRLYISLSLLRRSRRSSSRPSPAALATLMIRDLVFGREYMQAEKPEAMYLLGL